MENKTLKPGQLATIKDKIFGTHIRAIVRASKEVAIPCRDCRIQNKHTPCYYLISREECMQVFDRLMFPIVIKKVDDI